MRITELRVFSHDLVVAGGRYQMAVSEVSALDTTVVQVLTDDGVSGFGEVCPLGPTYQPEHALGARAAIAEMAPRLLGLDPRRHGLIYQAMDAALDGHNYAKSALDVACWDLAGKAYGERVCDLLGGTVHDSARTWYGIMPGTPEEAAAKAKALQADGYTRLQVKVGGRPVVEDVARVRAVAAVLAPGVPLMADANRGWTVRETLEFSLAVADIGLSLENPCRTLAEHRQLRGRVPHPVFLDEASIDVGTVIDTIADGTAQGFGMKLSRIGGITKMVAVRDICLARNIPMTVDDTWGGDITASACIQVGVTLPESLYEGTWISGPYTESGYAMTSPPIEPIDGRLPLPSGPGLGVTPDVEAWGEPMAVHR